MEKLASLHLNKKEIDTSKAEDYLKLINHESSEWPESGWLFLENKPNDITKLERTKVESIKIHLIRCKTLLKNSLMCAQNLASKIEDNAEMFVQLEYIARGTDPRDVRDGHIKLMSQLARCNSALWNHHTFKFMYFTETTPLYNLAAVVESLITVHESFMAIIVENKKMKPLCQFFVQLCREIGLNITIIYANPNEFKLPTNNQFEDCILAEPAENMGCTGIVAERSDLDSAIDVFINSSITAPWRLTQIYVQESIFEEFKSALAVKCKLATSSYAIGNKTFLVECLVNDQPGIPTHAYRTTKELLSFIKTPYLTIWAAETALSHEIALLSPSLTVWVNEYATFQGPPRSALSVYNLFTTRLVRKNDLKETLKPWAKLRTTERLATIVAVLETSEDPQAEKLLPDFTHNYRSDEFIHVTENTVCFGVQRSLGIVYCNSAIEKQMAYTLKALVNGSAVANASSCDIVRELRKAGVPVDSWPITDDLDEPVSAPIVMERFKVVRTNYGTIFAN